MTFGSSSLTTTTFSISDTAFLAGGVTLAGAALSLWNLFRRRIPYLSQEDDLLKDPMGDLVVTRKFRPQDKEGLVQAFLTSPDFVWILKDGNKLMEKDMEDMTLIMSYLMEFCIYMAENYGHIIKSVDESGNYQGSIFLIPPISNWRMQAYMLAGLAHIGMIPSVLRKDSGRLARFFSMFQCEEHHHNVMKDCFEDHWYVLTLGVAPTAQGKRVGTRLLQQAIHLAGDAPMYLDCHNGNVAYYEKFGFQVGSNFALDVPKGKSNSKLYMNGMRRDPH